MTQTFYALMNKTRVPSLESCPHLNEAFPLAQRQPAPASPGSHPSFTWAVFLSRLCTLSSAQYLGNQLVGEVNI
jgi:hypothetical protein